MSETRGARLIPPNTAIKHHERLGIHVSWQSLEESLAFQAAHSIHTVPRTSVPETFISLAWEIVLVRDSMGNFVEAYLDVLL